MIRDLMLVLLMLTVITSVHEAGHMLAAMAFGAGVKEYAIGIGPAIFKHKAGDTIYSLRMFPLGGFCKIKDLDEEDNDEGPGACLHRLAFWKRALVTLAGPFSNLVLAFAVCTLILLIYGYYPARITSVQADGPSFDILQEGDLILSIDGHRARLLEDAMERIAASGGDTVTVRFLRDGKQMTASIKPRETENGRKLGIIFTLEKKRCGPLELVPCGLEKTASQAGYIISALRDAVLGRKKLQLAGIVGMASEVGTVIDAASSPRGISVAELLLTVLSLLSLNIGLINLMPLPAMDGGRTLFAIAEGITGKDLHMQEAAAAAVSILPIAAIFLYTFYSDFINYIWR